MISPVARISPAVPAAAVPIPIELKRTSLLVATAWSMVYGNLAAPNVPDVILDAFVVSVVADVAKPETAPEEMAIATLAALVILPVESTI